MTTRLSTFRRRTIGLLVLGTVAAALVAAGPAGAVPVNEQGMKSCGVKSKDSLNGTIWFEHGSEISGTTNGHTIKLRCNNGNWEVVTARPSRTVTVAEYSIFANDYGLVTALALG